MPTFAFQARDKQGQMVQGIREAPSRDIALTALRDAGFFVTQLAPANLPVSVTANASVPRSAPQAVVPSASAPQGAASRVEATQGTPANRPQIAAASAASPLEQPTYGAYDPLRRPPQREAGQEASPPVPPGGVSPQTLNRPGAPNAAGASANAKTKRPIDYTARASNRELSLFFRQMHSMINAGTGISQALTLMGEHGTNASLRRASKDMSGRVLNGETWSETMETYPGLFSELMRGITLAGESGGFLDRSCQRLADYAERDYEIEQNIKRETWYPKLLVFCSILIPAAVPTVLAMVQGTGNPFVAFLKSVALPLLLVGAVWVVWKSASWSSPLFKTLTGVRRAIDGIKLHIPVVAKISRALAAAKFCRAYGALYSSGMSPHRAVKISARACGNEAMKQGAERIIKRLENGDRLSETLGSTGYFPPIALMMLRTGEDTGALDTQLEKAADFLETDAETAIRQGVKVLGIVVFLCIAAYIGVQVAQFYLGYFNAAFQMGEDMATSG